MLSCSERTKSACSRPRVDCWFCAALRALRHLWVSMHARIQRATVKILVNVVSRLVVISLSWYLPHEASENHASQFSTTDLMQHMPEQGAAVCLNLGCPELEHAQAS